jgi:hypothetical protein
MADIKPTPTQDENDRAAMGEHVIDKEADGSPEQPPPDAPPKGAREKQDEAKKPAGGYSTRAMHGEQPAAAHAESHPTRQTHRRNE